MKKVIGYTTHTRSVDGARVDLLHKESYEKAVDVAHAEVNSLPRGRRAWKQPEVWVYEQFSDGTEELVYYEFAIQ